MVEEISLRPQLVHRHTHSRALAQYRCRNDAQAKVIVAGVPLHAETSEVEEEDLFTGESFANKPPATARSVRGC